MSYKTEDIPAEGLLYKYFPRSKYDKTGRPTAVSYLSVGSGMSTNWSKYCSAEECRSGLNRPHTFGVVSLHVECVRQEPVALTVQHSPRVWKGRLRQGQSHTDVLVDNDDLEEQWKLYEMAVPVIAPDPPEISKSEKVALERAARKRG